MAHGGGSHRSHQGRSGRDGGGASATRGNSARRETSARATATPTPRENPRATQGRNREQHNPRRVRETTTRAERQNHGSGTHHHSRGGGSSNSARATRTVPAATRNATTASSAGRATRPNHGSDAHSRNERFANRSAARPMPASQTRASTQERATRPNHGGGTHHPTRNTAAYSWWRRRDRSHRDEPQRVEVHNRYWWFAPRPRRHVNRETTHYSYSRYSYAGASRTDGDHENEPRSGLLCRFCACLVGIVLAFFAAVGAVLCCKPCIPETETTGAASTTRGSSNARASSSARRFSWLIPAGLLLSTLLWVGLMLGSALDTTLATDDNVWTLFAGETQRVYLPRLVRDVRVTVVSGTDPSVEAAVFKFSRRCPPLTGPKVTLQHDSEFDLAGGSFEYDYYNLYPGSTVEVRFTQLAGATDFYLLKGAEALKDIQTGNNIDPAHWEAIAKSKRFITPTTSPSKSNVFYTVNSAANDIFTLVYDNDSMRRDSSLDVQTDIVLTTYNLAGYTPQCDNMAWRRSYGDSCSVSATQDNCVILEAFSTGSEDELADSAGGDRVISLRIDVYRNWTGIWLISAAPLALVSFVWAWLLFVARCCRRRTTEDPNIEGGTEPLLPQDGDEDMERPPPIAPHHVPEAAASGAPHPQPSAPPEDPSVIVIPPESVEAVPIGGT